MFLKVQKSVGLRRTGDSLKIPVLSKLVMEAKDGRCDTRWVSRDSSACKNPEGNQIQSSIHVKGSQGRAIFPWWPGSLVK